MEPILNLVRAAFAYMDGVVDPPSSVHRLTETGIAGAAREGEVWVLEELGRPLACLFLTPKPGRLYIGKLAVAESHRRKGLARQLLAHAESRARDLGLPALEMQSRVELTGNHAAFEAMGFVRAGETAHEGYTRPTSFTFRKAVSDRAP
ncbi:GNAT family N-acetyltransferase [Defluviimonas sp. SAOS-178_SWC]